MPHPRPASRPSRSGSTGAAVLLSIAVCLAASPVAAGAEPAAIRALAETTPSRHDGATGIAVWVHPDDPARSLIVGGDENGGVAIYDLDGVERWALSDGPLKSVDLRYGVRVGADLVDLIVTSLEDETAIRFWAMDPSGPSLTPVSRLEIGIPGDGVCLYRSPFTSRLFAMVTSETGIVEQWQIDGEDGTITGRLARRIPVGSEVSSCAADDELGALYVSEEEVGVWRYGAEPEAGIARRLIDVGRQHRADGGLLEQAEGIAIAAYQDGAGYLLVANEKADAVNLYERAGSQAPVGSIRIDGLGAVDGVTEPGGIAVLPVPLGSRYPAGIVVTSDDTNTDPDGDRNLKIASWADALAAIGLPAVPSPLSVRRIPETPRRDRLPTVVAVGETAAVDSGLDAADDPAIYRHPTDPTLHAIVGTDKTGSLVVYGLDGSIRQVLAIGRMNNVDLRDDVIVGGRAGTLVAAVNRSDNALWLFAMDPADGTLRVAHRAPIASAVNEVYGLCLHRDPETGIADAFVNSSDTGEVEQHRIVDTPDGLVTEIVRTFVVGSQTEGCVVDDATGSLFIGEELVGIWRYAADAAGGDDRVQVDRTGAGGHLTADVEGLAIVPAGNEGGYLIASSQGNDTFAVYERAAPYTWLGSFRVVDGEVIDGVSGTDGIEATGADLGGAFGDGLLVVQDDRNREPDGNQNFKLIRWADVLAALGLGEVG